MLRTTSVALAALLLQSVAAAMAAPPVAPSTGYYAVVDTHGNLIRGSVGTAAIHAGTGGVIVTFPVDVTNCSYDATLARAIRHGGAEERAGFISVVRSAIYATGVFVDIRGPNNKPHDRPFHLFVAC